MIIMGFILLVVDFINVDLMIGFVQEKEINVKVKVMKKILISLFLLVIVLFLVDYELGRVIL